MRMARIWMILMIGGLLLTGTALAQSPDDDEEQGASKELIPSSSRQAALAEFADDEEQGLAYRAPGVHVWIGRLPSKEELQSAVTTARSQAKSLTHSVSDVPDFQNGRIKVWIGRLPKPETLRNMFSSGGGGR